MSLPRRYFRTSSSNTTPDILRTRDEYNTKVIDSNDVAGAGTVKTIINTQDQLQTTQNTIKDTQDLLKTRMDYIEDNTTPLGSYVDFETNLDINK